MTCEQWQTVTEVPTLADTEIHVWQIDLANQACCPEYMDDAERARWQAMQHPLSAQRFCAMRTALRSLLGAYLHIAPAAVQIALGKQGKPELINTTKPFFFNLSHTGHIAVIACSTNSPVGIDIERTRTITSERHIAERVFSPAYLAILQAAEYEPAVFLRLWVQWEAQQKCLGLGLLKRSNEPPPLDFFVGHWEKGQLSVAWMKSEERPRVRLLKLAPT